MTDQLHKKIQRKKTIKLNINCFKTHLLSSFYAQKDNGMCLFLDTHTHNKKWPCWSVMTLFFFFFLLLSVWMALLIMILSTIMLVNIINSTLNLNSCHLELEYVFQTCPLAFVCEVCDTKKCSSFFWLLTFQIIF